jgi:ribonuclease HII
MKKIHSKFPEYGWNKNKGYGTTFHMDMINKHGKTDFHRKTFNIKKLQLKIQYK